MSESERIAGRYQPLERVGAGGMGVVFRARDHDTGDEVALKVIRDDRADLSARFDREVRLLGELRHPSIVRYIDGGRTDRGRPFLVMEWIEGPTLRQRIDESGLDLAESVAVVGQVNEALSRAHGRGVLHRDVKPSNVILASGDLERAVLIDFGLARRTDHSDGLTRSGVALGTPGYMAPEQALGRRNLEASSDLFALGCVFHECLTGQAPFAAVHRTAVLAKIVLSAPPPVTAFGVPRAFGAIVDRLLQKRPSDRFDNCEAVESALADLSVPTTSPKARGVPLDVERPSTASGSEPACLAVVIPPESDADAARPTDVESVALVDGAWVMAAVGPDAANAAARWALEAQARQPDARVAIVATEANAGAIGAAGIDRATGAILGHSIRDVFADSDGGPRGIQVDEATAGRLTDPFASTVIGSHRVLASSRQDD